MVNPPRHDRGRRSGPRPPSRDGRIRQDTQRNDAEMKKLCGRIVLLPQEGASLSPDLFDGIAEEAAKIVAKDKTKTSQLRRFYDELLRWEDKVNNGDDPKGAKDRLRRHLPFIRMINAKAAYAAGRKVQGRSLVGPSFVELLRTCLDQVDDDPMALRNCQLFFEAFMGFYKLHGND